uniref:CTP synthase (glutamine hydrolyzing) n=1 Tax=Pavo cristatus TaxID=9049 RepID=A0A8C9FHN3_PAVCR
MPEHNPGDMGGTMRLGKRRTVFKTQNSILRKLYGDEMFVEERHRHRYEVNLLIFFDICLVDHPYFVGVQFHPEFSSRPMKPSPPYLGLLLAATGTLNAYLQRGCKLGSEGYSLIHTLQPEGSKKKTYEVKLILLSGLLC